MIIYMTVNLINKKIYIGQDSMNRSEYLGSGLLISNAIKRYGSQNFHKIILEHCSSKDELDEREKFWINKLNSNKKGVGYNIARGGEGGDVLTNHPRRKEIIKKMSLHGGNRKGAKLSRESKDRISKSKSGTHWGHHTEETKKRMSEIRVGMKFSEEHRRHLRENHRGMLGKIVSVETRRKIGFKNSLKKRTEEQKSNLRAKMTGRRHTEEARQKISLASKRMWAKRKQEK